MTHWKLTAKTMQGTASDPGIIPRIIDVSYPSPSSTMSKLTSVQHLFMLKENSAPSELEISLSYVVGVFCS